MEQRNVATRLKQETDLQSPRDRSGRVKLPRNSFYLLILSGHGMGRRCPLDTGITSIGRDETCDIKLDDASVSRVHLEISQEEDKAWMTDLSSTNGTLINGVEVNRRELQAGDVLRVGDISMRLNRGFRTETPDLDDLFALSARDPLTGASTVHHYRVIREREASRSRRFHTPLTEATISLSVHGCPDTTIEECMWAVGRALANVCRHEDVIGKITSDCFALLMPHTGKHAGESAINRLEHVVSETLPGHLKGLEIRYSVRQISEESSGPIL